MASKFKSSVEIDGYLSISSGNWIQVPDGTTAQRPGSPAVGMFRYNTTTAEFEGYFGSTPAWGAIGGGGSGTVTEAFKTFAVSGQSSIVADGPTDTLTVAAGNNITLTTDAATDTLTIASTGGGSGGGTVTIQRNNYTGDGSTVAYGVSSTVASENNIQIYLDGVYQDKDTFTATGVTVTFGTAPPTGTEIEIMHYVSVNGVIEVDEFVGDGTTTNFATSLSIINEDATSVYVSGVYQSKLTYQTTGNVVSFQTAPPNGANIEVVHVKALALSGFNKNNFVGTGSQTAFTLNTTVNEENMTFVFLEGIYQDKSTYTISGTTLTFTTAPQSGYNIEVMVLGAISASTNALYTDTFTGDGSQTAYALGITPVDLNAVEVYLNGLYQNVSTLTLSTNTITFATAPPSGVIIEIRSVGFLNSGGTLAPATLTGGTGINITTNSPNNFTIASTSTGSGIDWQTTIYTATFSANPGKGYIVNTTAGEVTVNLPAGVPGNIIGIQDYAGTFDTNKLLINSNGSEKIQGSTDNYQCKIKNATIYLLYQDATKGWTADNIEVEITSLVASGGTEITAGGYKYHTFTGSGNLTVTTPGSFEYLIVAGAGAGGYDGGGGGGAGGLLQSSGIISTTGTYPVVIGAGGAAVTGYTQPGNGTASTFNSLSATGGGAASYCSPGSGGYVPSNASAGGSGGGGMLTNSSQTSNGGAGTAGQGNAGGNGTAYSGENWRGAGGGGAGGAGAANPSGAGGNGGAGRQFIAWGTATSTGANSGYYSGGGGGAAENSVTYGTGGLGGGGRGGSGNSGQVNGTPGTANTGGGGGGCDSGSSGAGGSGIVIIRYST